MLSGKTKNILLIGEMGSLPICQQSFSNPHLVWDWKLLDDYWPKSFKSAVDTNTYPEADMYLFLIPMPLRQSQPEAFMQLIKNVPSPSLIIHQPYLCEQALMIYNGSPDSLATLTLFSELLASHESQQSITVLSTKNFGKKKLLEERQLLGQINKSFQDMAYIKIPDNVGESIDKWLKKGAQCLVIGKDDFLKQKPTPQLFKSIFLGASG